MNIFSSHFICGPNGWGKSTNLQMLNSFFAIEQEMPSKVINTADNPFISMFINTKIFREEREFVVEHFGQYPVIYLDFEQFYSDSLESLISGLLKMCEKIRARYSYLLKDDSIIKADRVLLSNPVDIKVTSPSDFIIQLITFLHNYYKRSCIVLMDECDLPLRTVMEAGADRKEKEKVFTYLKSFLGTILNSYTPIRLSVLTGTSHFGTFENLSIIKNFVTYRFIDGKFVDYFGVTVEEVKSLIYKVPISNPSKEDLTKLLKQNYGGYIIKDQEIYNTFSIIKALDEIYELNEEGFDITDEIEIGRIFANYWYNSENSKYLKQVFEDAHLDDLLANLLHGVKYKVDHSTLRSTNKEMYKLFEDHSKMLEAIITKNNTEINKLKENAVMSFLCINGYLNAIKCSNKEYELTIPNQEIYETLREIQQSFVLNNIRKNNINVGLLKRNFLQALNMDKSNSFIAIKWALMYLFAVLDNITKLTKENLINEGGFLFNENIIHSAMVFLLYHELGIATASEIMNPDKRGRLDLMYYSSISKRAIIIEFKLNRSAIQAFKQTEKYVNTVATYCPKVESIIRLGLNVNYRNKKLTLQYKCNRIEGHSIVDDNSTSEYKKNRKRLIKRVFKMSNEYIEDVMRINRKSLEKNGIILND